MPKTFGLENTIEQMTSLIYVQLHQENVGSDNYNYILNIL